MSWQLMRLLVELSLNLHFFMRLRAAFGGGWWQLPVLFWLALMMLPIFFMRRGLIPPEAMEVLMWVGPIWTGFLIIFTVTALGFDLLRLVTGLAGSISGRSWWSLLAAKRAVPITLILAALLTAHSFYQAYHPRLVKIELSTKRLPENLDSLRLVQLTDVHLSRFIGQKELSRMVKLAAEQKPDILVVTGDLVDGDMSRRTAEADLLANIKPRYGSYAVLGNHEMYAGLANALSFYQRAGLRLLRGEAVETAGGMIVAGVDDEVFGGRYDIRPAGKLLDVYKNDPRFILFLKHRPVPAPGTDGLFDLQLSGHTHGGQIFPGHIIIKKVNTYLYGLYSLNSRSRLYVSRGTGFWGLPIRFMAPPEVVVIDLKRKLD